MLRNYSIDRGTRRLIDWLEDVDMGYVCILLFKKDEERWIYEVDVCHSL